MGAAPAFLQRREHGHRLDGAGLLRRQLPHLGDCGILPRHRAPSVREALVVVGEELVGVVEVDMRFVHRRVVEIRELEHETLEEFLARFLDYPPVEIEGAGDDLPLVVLQEQLLAEQVDEVRIGRVEAHDVRILGQHRGHDRREVGGVDVEVLVVDDVDACRLERSEIGRDGGPPELVVLGADRRGLELRSVLRQPLYAGHVVERMHLGGRQVIERIGGEIARQQGGRQHLLLGEELHGCRRVGSAQHHDHLDVVLKHQLLGADQGPVRQVLVIVRYDLDHVVVVADLDAAGRVDLIGPNQARIAARQGPTRHFAGERPQKAELDYLLGTPRDMGGAERRRGNGAGRSRGRARKLPACKSLLAHDWSPCWVRLRGAPWRGAICRSSQINFAPIAKSSGKTVFAVIDRSQDRAIN